MPLENFFVKLFSAIEYSFGGSPLIDDQHWWIEITTAQPHCTYYFGPFQNPQEAESMRQGYIEDLQAEGAKEIQAIVKHCQPEQLTVFDE